MAGTCAEFRRQSTGHAKNLEASRCALLLHTASVRLPCTTSQARKHAACSVAQIIAGVPLHAHTINGCLEICTCSPFLSNHPGQLWPLIATRSAAHLKCWVHQVILLGHSAGGWLGRAFMADPLYFETPAAEPDAPHQAVAQLVTLGTPHCAPASELARDMTGGALTWVNRTYPGAHAALPIAPQQARSGHRVAGRWAQQGSAYEG